MFEMIENQMGINKIAWRIDRKLEMERGIFVESAELDDFNVSVDNEKNMRSRK